MVWKVLSATYGGGTKIVRESMDIYSKRVSSQNSESKYKEKLFLLVSKLEKAYKRRAPEEAPSLENLSIMEQVLVEDDNLPRHTCLVSD